MEKNQSIAFGFAFFPKSLDLYAKQMKLLRRIIQTMFQQKTVKDFQSKRRVVNTREFKILTKNGHMRSSVIKVFNKKFLSMSQKKLCSCRWILER